MLRSRVRRSFTVEVKSKNRHTPSWPEDPTPSPVNWAALDPAPETPSPFDAFWPDEAAAPAPAAPAEKPRRILPSLIVAEPEPEPETVEPASAREPRLPRVRRVKPPQARPEGSHAEAARPELARPAAIWSFADIADAASEPAVAAIPPVQARPTPVAPAPTASRKVVTPRTAKPALAPGERWKRRLPRSCR
ncbi:hypothetical protein AFCDBAGC_4667 [Methylobacterium cerastii]|uniref:DNA-binding protein n=2 Tax=Methylobacterium TaxID=407 RepID=A0ABQ4QNF3_9HYPH|nr:MULTISPECIES: hypothetical protein [Methylobacterium]TXN83273.1 hypothetical protein FV234_06885 [Methylobacterium sp. WL8]GJD46783.1 hypothetical protein AFCDBAGC_4667 [Methylobacterium cerastii]